MPLFDFNEVPFYWVVPGSDPNSSTDPEHPEAIWEGIGNGWYLSELGGGTERRPSGGVTTDLTFDNTEVPKPKVPVPTVFNGDFENGTRQSLLNWIDGTDKGRFPLSYELPGWSFHGGEGYSFMPALADVLNEANLLSGPVADIAGLFVIETNPSVLVKDFLKKVWNSAADKLLNYAKNKFSPAPPAPNDQNSQGYTDWYNENWGPGTANASRKALADKFFDFMDKKFNELIQAGLGAFNLENAIKVGNDPNNPAGFAGIKSYLAGGIEQGFKALFPSEQSDHAFIMGAGKFSAMS